MKRLSLSQKALLAVFLILLPVVVIFLHTYKKTEEHVKEDMLKELAAVAEGYEGHVYQFIEMARRRASDFSSDGFTRDRLKEIMQGSKPAASALTEHLIRNKITLDRTIYKILVVSMEGKVVSSTDPAQTGRDISGEEFFVKGKEGISVTETKLPQGGLPSLVVTSPVLSSDTRRPMGMVANVILLSELDKLMSGEFKKEFGAVSRAKKRPKSMEVYLVNGSGVMISHSQPGKAGTGLKRVNTAPVRECLDPGGGASGAGGLTGFYANYTGVAVAGASVCLPSMKWALMVEMEKTEALAAPKVILRGALTTGVIVLAMIGAFFAIFLRAVVRPIRKMAGAVKEITGGNYDISVPVKTSDEIGTLSGAFNVMAMDIKKGTLALKESGERLKKAQQIAKMGSWEWDIAKNEITYSDEIYRVYGLSREELGSTYEQFLGAVHPGDRELVKMMIGEALYGGRPFFTDYRILSRGEERVINAHGEVSFDAAGNPARMSGIAQDITERKLSEAALLKKTGELDLLNKDLHGLTMRMTVIEERERKRFAEILHESIGQNLVAIKLAYRNFLKRHRAQDNGDGAMEQILALLDETIQTSRTMTADLYTAPLKARGLCNSVNWYVESILKPGGIKVFLDMEEAVEALTDEVQQVIFSIIRESFQNVSKYASATRVSVTCKKTGGGMRLVIRDNGAGFVPEEVKSKPGRGFGQILMREWAKSIGGAISIQSEPGRGTEVAVEFPA